MAKMDDIRSRFGGNLAESMGANRAARGGALAAARPDPLEGTERYSAARTIEVARIEADPDQPRTEFDTEEIARLAASLEDHGQLQPILVRPAATPGRFIIVTGERRHRASIAAGRRTIAAVVIEEDAPARLFTMQLVENCLRADLKPIEQARAFRRAMDQNGWSALRLGEALKVSESSIIKAIALLTIPEPVQELVEAGKLPPAVAYEIKKADPADHQTIADRVVSEGLSRDETIELARASRSRKPAGQGGTPRSKAQGKAGTIRERKFRAQGLRVEATRPKGFDLPGLAAALEAAAAEVRAEIASE